MDKEWKIIFYENENGECPMDDFMNLLSDVDKEKIVKWIKYLKNVGAELRRPQGDYLREGIYELRVRLQSYKQTRTLYFFCFENYIVLTHSFAKTTEEVPQKEINKALKFKENFLQKYNKNNIEEAYNVSRFHKI